MWFEGTCKVSDFPSVLTKNLTTIPVGQTTPFWEMVSSNIGNLNSDDGYVFHSKGTSGKDSLYIGIKANEVTNHYNGVDIFVTDRYTPSDVQGQNGLFGDLMTDTLRYDSAHNFNGVNTPDKFYTIWYGMSVTKDRVIIVIRNPIAIGHGNGMSQVTYMGLISRFSNEIDSSALALITTHSDTNNYNPRILRNKQQQVGTYYSLTYRDMLDIHMGSNQNGRGSNNTMFVSPALVYLNDEGFRGQIDGMLFSVGYPNSTHIPYLFKKVKIGEKNYLMLSFPSGYQNAKYSKFAGNENSEYSIFVEMK
jgi:hypothetical protein